MTRNPMNPGETPREDLEELGMSVAELARRIEVSTNRVTEILNGRLAVSGDTALRLGRFFGTSGEFWFNLQKLYELRLTERKSGAEIAGLSTLEDDNLLRALGGGSQDRRQQRYRTSPCWDWLPAQLDGCPQANFA